MSRNFIKLTAPFKEKILVFKDQTLDIDILCEKFCNNSLTIELLGSNSCVNLKVIHKAMAMTKQETVININHCYKNSHSNIDLKSVCEMHSSSSFICNVHMDKNTDGSVSSMLHKGLLLDSTSKILCQPNLIIDNDDIKCSHGNTISNIDKQLLNYLQSRGNDIETSKRMIIESFLS